MKTLTRAQTTRADKFLKTIHNSIDAIYQHLEGLSSQQIEDMNTLWNPWAKIERKNATTGDNYYHLQIAPDENSNRGFLMEISKRNGDRVNLHTHRIREIDDELSGEPIISTYSKKDKLELMAVWYDHKNERTDDTSISIKRIGEQSTVFSSCHYLDGRPTVENRMSDVDIAIARLENQLSYVSHCLGMGEHVFLPRFAEEVLHVPPGDRQKGGSVRHAVRGN